MKGDGFQSAIIRAHSFTLNMQHSGCTQGRLFLFHFHNFYAAARSLHGVCFEFGLQCISDCFCTDLGVSDVAESSLSPIRHHDVARGGASGRIAKTCQCRLRPRPGCRKVRSEKRKGRGSEPASPASSCPAPPSRAASPPCRRMLPAPPANRGARPVPQLPAQVCPAGFRSSLGGARGEA